MVELIWILYLERPIEDQIVTAKVAKCHPEGFTLGQESLLQGQSREVPQPRQRRPSVALEARRSPASLPTSSAV